MECRICFGADHPETMLAPCHCRGTSAFVHESCLRTYFHYYPDRVCRVCHELMGHPWIDRERNLLCATFLLVWGGVLLALSTVPLYVKLFSYTALTGLVMFHVKRERLTYAGTFLCLATSGLLFLTEPQYLPQTIFLAATLLILATLFLFVPVETLCFIMVVALALAYSVLLTLAIAVRTDPAFTGLFLLSLSAFWLVFLRPTRVNDVYP